ncbi:MAG TPA: LysR family transcriptional regulator [Bordetella sp.]
MNTEFIKTLVAVARHGSMAEAARRLGLTHGAVAQQIRVLEKDLGADLVARAGRTVHLTEKGAELLGHFDQMLEQVEKIRYMAKSNELMGELRLGAGMTALTTVVPRILERLVKQDLLINVDIQPGHSVSFYPEIEAGRLDIAIALEAPYELPKSQSWHLLREEPYVLVAAARHAGKDPHRLLATQPLIRYSLSDWGGRHADEYLHRANIQPNVRFELNAIESIAVMISRDLGVAILPVSTSGAIRRLKLATIPLPRPCEPRRVGLIWQRASPRASLIKVFLDAAVVEYKRYAIQMSS